MKVVVEGQLMKAKKKDYEFDGKKGTSYKLDVYSGDSLETVSVSAETYAEHKNMIGDEVSLECNLFAKSYNLKHIEEEQ